MLAVLTLLAPGLVLLAAGLPPGWSLLASGLAVLAAACAVYLHQALSQSNLFVTPALIGFVETLISLYGACDLLGLALALGAGLALGLLVGVGDVATAAPKATGIALLWLALAAAWPPLRLPDSTVAEALGLGLLAALLLVLWLGRAPTSSLAVIARLAATSSQGLAHGVPVVTIRLALAGLTGFAAGLAGFAWSSAASLGAEPPGVILLALALFAGLQLLGRTLFGLLAAYFVLLQLPLLIGMILPKLPMSELGVCAALVAHEFLRRGGPILLRSILPPRPPGPRL